MASPIQNNWSIRKLVNSTYAHQETRTRFKYKQRDMVRAIRIEETKVYDGKNPGEARTKFIITTRSTPQYFPYFTSKDSRGRSRKRQIKYKHLYQVTIQLDELSIDAPLRLRTGSSRRWDFGPQGKTRRIKMGNRVKIIEGSNIVNGRNGDFFFRLEYLYARENILFGRDWTNGPPRRTNPKRIIFLDKHSLAVIEFLLNSGYFK